MNRLGSCLVAMACGFGVLALNTGASHAASEIYAPAKFDEVRGRVLAWLGEQNLSEAQREQVTAVWMGMGEAVAPDRLLELVVQSFAIADPDALKLLNECNSVPSGLPAPKVDFLKQQARSPFFLSNMNLFYGRYLVERRLFDEAWEILKSIDAHQVVDPSFTKISSTIPEKAG